jgi:hypothetical protein
LDVGVRVLRDLDRKRVYLIPDVIGGKGDDGAVGSAGEEDCDLLLRTALRDISLEMFFDFGSSSVRRWFDVEHVKPFGQLKAIASS